MKCKLLTIFFWTWVHSTANFDLILVTFGTEYLWTILYQLMFVRSPFDTPWFHDSDRFIGILGGQRYPARLSHLNPESAGFFTGIVIHEHLFIILNKFRSYTVSHRIFGQVFFSSFFNLWQSKFSLVQSIKKLDKNSSNWLWKEFFFWQKKRIIRQ